MKKKITVKDLRNFKSKKKLVCILIKNKEIGRIEKNIEYQEMDDISV